MEVWVQERGKSEGSSVMEGIGVEQTRKITPRESGQTSTRSPLTREQGKPIKEAKQMMVEQTGAASHDIVAGWHDIDWQAVHRNVRRLQARIVKATKEGRWGKVKALQRLLTHSYSGKALAVRRVTENQGGTTPGVDGVIWNTPQKKATAIATLRQRGYHPQPLRRVSIPKRNGKQRPLGMPMLRSYCPPYRVLSGFVAKVGSDLPTHSPSTVPYFADTDECLAVSNVAERACVALR